MSNTSTPVHCAECGMELAVDPETGSVRREPCPGCGTIGRYAVEFDVVTDHSVSLRLKAKRGGVGKPFYESFSGDDLHRDSGRVMRKDRVIDREGDHYHEKVVDPQTGEVVHFCDEPLSEHHGHGDAKRKDGGNG